MAQAVQPNLVQPVAAPQHFAPPSGRELRSQAVHRLQVGLFGLSAMLLLVGLASIINDRVRIAEAENGTRSASAATIPDMSRDPLADIGVVPSAEPSVAVGPNAGAR